MVLRADVLARAIDAAGSAAGRLRPLMSPRGRPLTQQRVAELAAGPGPLIVCAASFRGHRPAGDRREEAGRGFHW